MILKLYQINAKKILPLQNHSWKPGVSILCFIYLTAASKFFQCRALHRVTLSACYICENQAKSSFHVCRMAGQGRHSSDLPSTASQISTGDLLRWVLRTLQGVSFHYGSGRICAFTSVLRRHREAISDRRFRIFCQKVCELV